MIANYASMDIRPGSMGRPLPGIEAGIVRRSEDGSDRSDRRAGCRRRAGAAARLAVDVSRLPARRGALPKCFAGGWYLTGDLARRDADGYFWFVGRADDVIKSAGHLIGPFEVESALDGASGGGRSRRDRQARPDGGRDGQGVRVAEARLSRRAKSCARELLGFARKRLGAAVAPKEIDLSPTCPTRAAARSCAGC